MVKFPPSRQPRVVPSLSDRGGASMLNSNMVRDKMGRVLQPRLVLNGTTVVRAVFVAALALRFPPNRRRRLNIPG